MSWKDSNRPRPAAAIKDGETVYEFTNRLFSEGKLTYEDGKVFKHYDFRGKGSWKAEPEEIGYVSANGYTNYALRFNGEHRHVSLHRLIYAYFYQLSDFPQDLVVNHIDGNRTNNRIENLELVTQQENITHALDTGLRKIENTNTARLTWEDVGRVRKLLAEESETSREIAEKFGVSKSTVDRIRTGKAWVERGLNNDEDQSKRLA